MIFFKENYTISSSLKALFFPVHDTYNEALNRKLEISSTDGNVRKFVLQFLHTLIVPFAKTLDIFSRQEPAPSFEKRLKNLDFPYLSRISVGLISVGIAFFCATDSAVVSKKIALQTLVSIVSKFFINYKAVNAFAFYWIQGRLLNSFIHELGHVAAVKILLDCKIRKSWFNNYFYYVDRLVSAGKREEPGYQFANELIWLVVNPGNGVVTYIGKLNTLGKYFGEDITIGIISLAGPLIQLISDLGFMTLGMYHYEKKRDFAMHCLISSMLSINKLGRYALNALDPAVKSSDSHDFVNIYNKLKIHPLVCFGITLAASTVWDMILPLISCTFEKKIGFIKKDIKDLKQEVVALIKGKKISRFKKQGPFQALFSPKKNIYNPLTKWKLKLIKEMEYPYIYRLKKLTKYDKNAFFIKNIFLNTLHLFLVPFVLLFDVVRNQIKPYFFSKKVEMISALESLSYVLPYYGIMQI